jgi:hypothetical protein
MVALELFRFNYTFDLLSLFYFLICPLTFKKYQFDPLHFHHLH